MPKKGYTRILCCVCHQFFETPNQCLECSNWNVCLPCLKKESDELTKKLAARGITLPGSAQVDLAIDGLIQEGR